jgi:hypothetical protein
MSRDLLVIEIFTFRALPPRTASPKTLAGRTWGSKPAKVKAEPEEKELANPPTPRPKR